MDAKICTMINDLEVAPNEAVISIFDLGLTRGLAVFEMLRTYNGKPFGLREHIERLIISAKSLNLKIENSIEEIELRVNHLLRKRGDTESTIRMVLTGGMTTDRILPNGSPNLIIAVYPLEKVEESLYINGIQLMSVPNSRIMPTIKSTHYFPAILSIQQARVKGFDDILYRLEDDRITESSTSNLFFIKNGTLYTPNEHILPGITRQSIIDYFKVSMDIKVCDIYYDQLPQFDEAFSTSSIKEIMPISQIDEITYTSADHNSITHKMMKEYQSLVFGEKTSLVSAQASTT
ncbi:MAG: aminotransferase class IV [Rhabdochlamydiaceae bacterium]|nr:aminotransferase class IV [Candidatus Amphrikana amoebophyrae]